MKNLILYGLLAAGAYIGYQQWEISNKRKWIADWGGNDPVWRDIVNRLTNDEVEYVYEFLTKYAPKTEADTMKPLPLQLSAAIETISKKYNIFT